jgi:hypothetical protein
VKRCDLYERTPDSCSRGSFRGKGGWLHPMPPVSLFRWNHKVRCGGKLKVVDQPEWAQRALTIQDGMVSEGLIPITDTQAGGLDGLLTAAGSSR